MDNKVISSLSEYLEVIKSNDKDIKYYRGEQRKYEEIQASGFRIKDLNITDEAPYLTMVENYKKEVWNRISNEDREHFLAFSQHHGIPTNLIDITENPLVALYFSCKNNQEKRGYVYLFKDKGIDVTNLIKNSSINNLLESVRTNEQVFQDFGKLIQEFMKENEKAFYELFINSIMEFKKMQRVGIDMDLAAELEEKVKEHSKNPIDNYRFLTKPINAETCKKYKNYTDIVELAIKIIEDETTKFNPVDIDNNNIVSIYLNIIICIIKNIFFSDFINDIKWLPKMFYSPIMNFNRGNNQQGLFLVQVHLTCYDGSNEKRLLKQEITPDEIIIVENKEKILRELDNININQKFLFNDLDNIAEYVKTKYIENNKESNDI